METNIQFQKNAAVLMANGKQVGSIERVVVNPESKVVTDIVVRTGSLLNHEDKVVPIRLVAETTTDQIVLHDEAGELKAFPLLAERRIVDANEDTIRKSSDAPPVIYGSPGLNPVVLPSTPGEQFVTQIEQNIPKGTVAMKEGATVISAEGKNVGNVERVLADSSVDQVTYLLISTGMFAREKKLIPIKWVMTLGEDEVHLRVKKHSVEELANVSMVA